HASKIQRPPGRNNGPAGEGNRLLAAVDSLAVRLVLLHVLRRRRGMPATRQAALVIADNSAAAAIDSIGPQSQTAQRILCFAPRLIVRIRLLSSLQPLFLPPDEFLRFSPRPAEFLEQLVSFLAVLHGVLQII